MAFVRHRQAEEELHLAGLTAGRGEIGPPRFDLIASRTSTSRLTSGFETVRPSLLPSRPECVFRTEVVLQWHAHLPGGAVNISGRRLTSDKFGSANALRSGASLASTGMTKRILGVLVAILLALPFSGTAEAEDGCYVIEVPHPDGGPPIIITTCP